MARINLLPWREQLREERKQRFLVALGGTLAISAGLVFLGGQYFNGAIEQQDARNEAHRAERVDSPSEKNGVLMYFRAESLLSVAEFVRVNRNVDDDPEDNAADLARDMEQLSLATPETGERIASKVRFDLDLPSAAEDDMPLGPGIPLPEWDYRKNELLEDQIGRAHV